MASKEQETSEILDRLQDFCSSNGMEAEFEKFAEDHVDVFISCLDLNKAGVEEHPLEYHTVYRKYLAQFEAKIEAFIEKVLLRCHIFFLEFTVASRLLPSFSLSYCYRYYF